MAEMDEVRNDRRSEYANSGTMVNNPATKMHRERVPLLSHSLMPSNQSGSCG